MTRVKWSQRRFALGLPAESAPELIERLRGTPARVQDRTATLSAETLTAPSAQAGWSIQEHVGHLLDLEALFMGRLDDFDEGRRVLRPADMSNRATVEAHHNERALEDILRNFRRARLALVARLEAMDSTALTRTAHHPRLDTPMRVVDMIYFQAEHDDYHLVSITELLRR